MRSIEGPNIPRLLWLGAAKPHANLQQFEDPRKRRYVGTMFGHFVPGFPLEVPKMAMEFQLENRSIDPLDNPSFFHDKSK